MITVFLTIVVQVVAKCGHEQEIACMRKPNYSQQTTTNGYRSGEVSHRQRLDRKTLATDGRRPPLDSNRGFNQVPPCGP
jgi:hypothetical protein